MAKKRWTTQSRDIQHLGIFGVEKRGDQVWAVGRGLCFGDELIRHFSRFAEAARPWMGVRS